MSWNYRIVREKGTLAVHEVYYDENGEPNGMTVNEVSPHGEDMDELMESWICYQKAFEMPVLHSEDLEWLAAAWLKNRAENVKWHQSNASKENSVSY